MIEFVESEMYLRRLEQEIAQKLGVMPSSVDIVWCAPVSEHCVYVEGKYYDYLNNEGISMNEVIWSADEDDWAYGHECLEDLFDQLESDNELNEGITVYYGERKAPSTNFVGVSDIVELMGERAYDVGGEFAYDYPDVTPKCPEWKELEDFLTQWQAKFQPSFYTVVNVKKHVVTQEEIDKWR